MATVVQKTLLLEEANIKQYCSADGLSLSAGGYAIRKWLNGSTSGYATLNSAAKEVLYPSTTAHPFKADSEIRGSRSAGSMTVNLEFAGTVVDSESFTSTSLKTVTKTDISDAAVMGSTRDTEIRWNVKGKNGDAQRIAHVKITLYFNQYNAQAFIGNDANGVQSVSVSNTTPYYGDTITFGVKLVQGATFDGWYSDSACTQLVSTDTTYSMAPTADVTLYAKATTDATLYNVSAVAGSEITDVSVSDSIVPEGGTATFTAQVNTGCSFEAWYSDDTYTTVVSTENPYTATITANTTLYAKAHRNSLNMSVGSAEHGTASVSATTALYGSDVTFTFTPEDETWELYGWYSDSELTQLVSEANPYTFTATEDVTLYPKVGRIRYTITLTTAKRFSNSINKIMSYDYSLLTDIEKTYLKTGEFDKIEQSKIFEQQTVKGEWIETKTASIQCPLGYAISIYLQGNEAVVMYISRDNIDLTAWPYYTTFPTEDQEYLAIKGDDACYCKAVMVDGILSADATTPVSQEKEAIFTAEIMAGYTFSGWYSDRACTTLVSTDNPAKVATPKYTGDGVGTTSLTLYAKATKATYTIGVGTVEHCTTSVSATTAQYGDTVTFSCVVNEGYEFKGWYSDEGLTQLVSESVEYVHSVTGNVTLWARVEQIVYDIKFGRWPGSVEIVSWSINVELYTFDYKQLSTEDIFYLDSGQYSNISKDKILDHQTASGNSYGGNNGKRVYAEVSCPDGACIAMRAYPTDNYAYSIHYYVSPDDPRPERIPYPYYWYIPTCDQNFGLDRAANNESEWCTCTAISKDSLIQVCATSPTLREKNAIFKASPSGYVTKWYSDESCTTLVGTGNPFSIKTPTYSSDAGAQNSLILYAKAESTTTSTTGISLKRNSSWMEAKSAYRKVNGAWVADTDYCKTLLSQKDRIGTFVHIV